MLWCLCIYDGKLAVLVGERFYFSRPLTLEHRENTECDNIYAGLKEKEKIFLCDAAVSMRDISSPFLNRDSERLPRGLPRG